MAGAYARPSTPSGSAKQQWRARAKGRTQSRQFCVGSPETWACNKRLPLTADRLPKRLYDVRRCTALSALAMRRESAPDARRWTVSSMLVLNVTSRAPCRGNRCPELIVFVVRYYCCCRTCAIEKFRHSSRNDRIKKPTVKQNHSGNRIFGKCSAPSRA